MGISRRQFLGWLSAAGVGVTAAKTAQAASNKQFDGYPGAFGILHDTTRCIGCRKCVKESPEGGFVVEDFLARIDYSLTGDRSAAEKACPTKCIISVLPAGEDAVPSAAAASDGGEAEEDSRVTDSANEEN